MNILMLNAMLGVKKSLLVIIIFAKYYAPNQFIWVPKHVTNKSGTNHVWLLKDVPSLQVHQLLAPTNEDLGSLATNETFAFPCRRQESYKGKFGV